MTAKTFDLATYLEVVGLALVVLNIIDWLKHGRRFVRLPMSGWHVVALNVWFLFVLLSIALFLIGVWPLHVFIQLGKVHTVFYSCCAMWARRQPAEQSSKTTDVKPTES